MKAKGKKKPQPFKHLGKFIGQHSGESLKKSKNTGRIINQKGAFGR